MLDTNEFEGATLKNHLFSFSTASDLYIQANGPVLMASLFEVDKVTRESIFVLRLGGWDNAQTEDGEREGTTVGKPQDRG